MLGYLDLKHGVGGTLADKGDGLGASWQVLEAFVPHLFRYRDVLRGGRSYRQRSVMLPSRLAGGRGRCWQCRRELGELGVLDRRACRRGLGGEVPPKALGRERLCVTLGRALLTLWQVWQGHDWGGYLGR